MIVIKVIPQFESSTVLLEALFTLGEESFKMVVVQASLINAYL
jgi:hypothetical protein